jgi:hypothetical protein
MRLSKFIPVAFIVALFFSCKKDDNGSAPTKQAYLPASFNLTASDGSFTKYGLAYNDDNSVATLTTSMSMGEGEVDTVHFSHNTNGDCVKVTFTNNQGRVVANSDSLVYRDGKMIIFRLDGLGVLQDSAVFTFNSQGDVIMIGNKDTVRNGESKSLYYMEFSIVNGNPQSFTTYGYYAASATTEPQITNYSSIYTYDNKPNAFQGVFRADPFLVYLLSNSALSYISMGQNNITGATFSGSGFDFTNTYDTVTGYLSSQQMAMAGTTLTIDYTYVKSK